VVIQRDAASGSDRIAQLLGSDAECARARIVVNVQGDEPLLEPAAIDAAVECLRADPEVDIATLSRPIRADERADDPDLVKVAVGERGFALYFSRAAIPHGDAGRVHVGLYAFRRDAFDRFAASAPTSLERAERLEQLRALEIGLRIRVAPFDSRSIGRCPAGRAGPLTGNPAVDAPAPRA
jgi:3-deoxy-manno-octulosonate cytidylyltransferase (CMP-KDO synthetase)